MDGGQKKRGRKGYTKTDRERSLIGEWFGERMAD